MSKTCEGCDWYDSDNCWCDWLDQETDKDDHCIAWMKEMGSGKNEE